MINGDGGYSLLAVSTGGPVA